MLTVENVVSRYGRIEALHGVSFEVRAGEIVTIVGSNGAGKTTLMRAVSGLQPVAAGSIRFEGAAIDAVPAHRRLRLGIAQVPEGRQVFAPLEVEDNLLLGGWSRSAAERAESLAEVYDAFPVLAERRRLPAGKLSGGQQQMLAIGRALMSRPRLLLLDEPSMGLAPILVDQVFELLPGLRARGLSLLVVEQNAHAALSIADRGYVMETGRVVAGGDAHALIEDPAVRSAYLGL
ncbi:MAG: ABC transporter ATP-binding protein [Burkholderiaceae bacterium]